VATGQSADPRAVFAGLVGRDAPRDDNGDVPRRGASGRSHTFGASQSVGLLLRQNKKLGHEGHEK